MMEWPHVCQSQRCMYKANPAADVWTNDRGNVFYLCVTCSVFYAPHLKRNHYTWSKLEPKDSTETTILKEYTE